MHVWLSDIVRLNDVAHFIGGQGGCEVIGMDMTAGKVILKTDMGLYGYRAVDFDDIIELDRKDRKGSYRTVWQRGMDLSDKGKVR